MKFLAKTSLMFLMVLGSASAFAQTQKTSSSTGKPVRHTYGGFDSYGTGEVLPDSASKAIYGVISPKVDYQRDRAPTGFTIYFDRDNHKIKNIQLCAASYQANGDQQFVYFDGTPVPAAGPDHTARDLFFKTKKLQINNRNSGSVDIAFGSDKDGGSLSYTDFKTGRTVFVEPEITGDAAFYIKDLREREINAQDADYAAIIEEIMKEFNVNGQDAQAKDNKFYFQIRQAEFNNYRNNSNQAENVPLRNGFSLKKK